MRLEKIVLNGFKSFADKTEFNFGEGITAIVGPNGCGKSNVVDALKWVLGDQSPKSLRSGQMTDVIFSGSGSRKPSGMSEVTLHFNQVSTGNEYGQEQLEVGRRLYRSGESEYLINNKSCRLKDIRELFMDTGVGVRAYSIIEQGQIDQLLHASKVDRRLIFEEAAGISKYKAHKKQALRKLERTEQNLLRLADIVTEVQRQLRSIKLQAGKARNYLEYTNRLKELRVKYSLSEYDVMIRSDRDKTVVYQQIEQDHQGVIAEVSRYDSQTSELGKQIIDTDNAINRSDNSLIAIRGKIEQNLERIEFLKQRLDELGNRKINATSQIKKLNDHIVEYDRDLSEKQRQLETTAEKYQTRQKQLVEYEHTMREVNSVCSSIEAELEDEKSGIIDSVRKTAQLHNEIQSMHTYRHNLTGQMDRLSGKIDESRQKLEILLTDKAQLNTRLKDIDGVLDELKTSLNTKRDEMSRIDQETVDINEQLAQLKEDKSGLSSEYTVLQEMEAKKEGLSKSLKRVLQLKDSGQDYNYIEGIVADILRAEPEYAPAIEAALEGQSDSLVINSTGRFLKDHLLRDELKGRLKVLCEDRIKPFVDTADLSGYETVIGRAAEFVHFEDQYGPLVWSLLGKVIIVDSLEHAVELAEHLSGEYRFVTQKGESFNGCESFSIGAGTRSTGLISRRSRLTELETNIAALGVKIKMLQEQIVHKNSQSEHLEKVCKNLRTSIYEANTEKVDTESKSKLIEQSIDRIREEEPVLTGEIKMLEQEISDSVQKEHDTQVILEETEAIKNEREKHIDELEKQYDSQRKLQEEKQTHITDLKIELGQLGEQQNAMKQGMTSLQSQLHHARMALEAARSEITTCDEQITETQRSMLGCESRISELYIEKETMQNTSRELHSKAEQLREEQETLHRLVKEKKAAQTDIEEHIHQLQLELNELKVKKENLIQRVSEELQMDLAEAYENFEQEDIDWEQVRGEITELKGKVERLGNVNVDAIDQQKELEERNEFLTQQVEDLTNSKSQLEQLINRINHESRDKFKETFEQVRENFQLLFRKLFGGGKADILLDDPDDLLESGIEILAKPPGKETRSISLLSGGEKTMTAIALQFSIFKSKPSPFCFLDEVDAALDEANNERFNMIVQEFQKHSQFIIITHSKRTMSIADVLFGVTMQTRGVSKKISVKFDSDADTNTAVA